jgi:NADPH2:quinone reductase
MRYMADPETYRRAAAEVLAGLDAGLAQEVGRRYPLADAAQAHADLESGATTGCLWLAPQVRTIAMTAKRAAAFTVAEVL